MIHILTVKSSQIENAGDGLFTEVPIKKGFIIAEFTGKVLTVEELEELTEEEQRYLIDIGNDLTLFCKDCFAANANDANFGNSGFKTNSKIEMWKNKVYLVATKNIKAGAEIFCSYGKEYWKNLLGFQNS